MNQVKPNQIQTQTSFLGLVQAQAELEYFTFCRAKLKQLLLDLFTIQTKIQLMSLFVCLMMYELIFFFFLVNNNIYELKFLYVL